MRVSIAREEWKEQCEVLEKASILAEERLLDILCPMPKKSKPHGNPWEALFDPAREYASRTQQEQDDDYLEQLEKVQSRRRTSKGTAPKRRVG